MHGVVSKRSHIWEFALQIHVFFFNQHDVSARAVDQSNIFGGSSSSHNPKEKGISDNLVNLFHSLEIVMRSR